MHATRGIVEFTENSLNDVINMYTNVKVESL